MEKKITFGPALSGLFLWVAWVLITPLGGFLFFVFLLFLGLMEAGSVFGTPSGIVAVAFLILGTIIGSLCGFLQWLVLRKRFPRSGLWVLTVLASWVLACEAIMFYPLDNPILIGRDLPVFMLALSALLASPFQYLLVRKLKHAAWWPLIVLVGWALAAAWSFYMIRESSLYFGVSSILGALMGGMLTGMGMLWLFYRPAERLHRLIGAAILTVALVVTGILVNELAFSQQTRSLSGHSSIIQAVAFNFDGTLLASAAMDGSVILREIPSGKILQQLNMNESGQLYSSTWIHQVAFNPDSSQLVAASGEGYLKIWDIASGELVFNRQIGQDGNYPCAIFSPDSLRLLAANNGSVNSASLWYIEGNLKAGSTPVPGFVYALGFSHGVAPAWMVESDENLVWMTAAGPIPYTSVEPGDAVLCAPRAALSTDGQHVAIPTGGLYTFERDRSITTIVYTPGISGGLHYVSGLHYLKGSWVNAMAFSPDGHFLVIASDWDKSIQVWETGDWTVVAKLRGGDTISAIAISPDGKTIVTGSHDGVVRLWRLPKAP